VIGATEVGDVKIGARTKVCGLIGNPVAHTMSPAMQNAAFEELGLDFVYLAFKVADVGGAVKGMRALGIRGFGVTVPHKVEVMKYLDEIDPVAHEIGAVNTVVNDDGYLSGYNTDWEGLVRALEPHASIENQQVVILGAGGAARAAAFAIRQRGGQVTILNRTVQKAQSLAEEVGGIGGPLSRVESISEADVVINATSVGMHPHVDDTIVEAQHLRPHQVVMDIVYNPLRTRFLREAEERGCVVIPGCEMLVLQGIVQFELWTEVPAPVDLMRAVVREHLGDRGQG
jgi:shikimate dehydrogenase